MRAVSPEEFAAFLVNYPNPLTQRQNGPTLCYLDSSDGAAWPDSLVASFLVANETRRRAGGWRIAVTDEPTEE